MVKILAVVFSILTLLSCASSGRKLAQSEIDRKLDAAKIIALARKYLKLEDEFRGRQFKLLRFPLSGPQDVDPVTLKTFDEVTQRGDIDEDWKTLAPMENFTEDQWNEESAQRDILRGIFVSNLSRVERDRLLNLCFTGPVHVGDSLSMAGTMAATMCKYAGLFHAEDEVRAALEAVPLKPTGVRYDGQLGYHQYSNRVLEKNIQIITAAVNTHLFRFYELFLNQSDEVKEKFRVNNDGMAEADKIEPFDLVSTYTVRFFIGKNSGRDDESETTLNKIQISKIVQKALARMLHMKQELTRQWQGLPNMTVNRSDNNISVMCANGLPAFGSSQFVEKVSWSKTSTGTQLVETWEPSYKMTELIAQGFDKPILKCNGVEYNFNIEKLEAEPIPPPAPIVLAPGQDLNALMTVSLVSEIDRSAIDQARKVIGYLIGWEVVGDLVEVESRKFFEEELPKTDAYFPVMHAMDVNYFNIGTERSFVLRLRKVVKDQAGNSRTLNLTIMLPNGTSTWGTLIMRPEELAKLLHARHLKKSAPLFLMNNSCSSEKTLLAWTLVFREALAMRKAKDPSFDISKVSDFPHVIGSKRSFGTSSLAEIFSHSDYPLRSLEMLGQGKPVAEIVEFLKAPPSASFVKGIINVFASSGKSDKSPDDGKGFDPDYIMEHPGILSLAGFRISVTSPAIQGRDQY
jgi:hypothetical protein